MDTRFRGNDGIWGGCGFSRAGTGTRPYDCGRGMPRTTTEGLSLRLFPGEPRVRLMIVMWIPAPRSGSGSGNDGLGRRNGWGHYNIALTSRRELL